MDHCHCYLSWVSQSWDEERDSQLVQTAIDLIDIKKCLLGNHTHTTMQKVRGKVEV